MATQFTDSFKVWIVGVIDGATRASKTDMKYIGWGTGAVAAAENATTLSTESSEARVTGVMSKVTTTVANDTYQVVGTLTANGTKTITNAAFFDASTSGNIGILGDFTGLPLVLNDGIEFTFKLQVKQ